MEDLEFIEGVLEGTIDTHGTYIEPTRRRQGGRHARGREGGRERSRRRHARGGSNERGGRRERGRNRRNTGYGRAMARNIRYEELLVGDPVMYAKLQALELSCKSEALMAFGHGRAYDRCLDLLRVSKLVEGVRSFQKLLIENECDTVELSDCTHIAAVAYALSDSPHPSVFPCQALTFLFPPFSQLESSGHAVAWLVSVFVAVQSIMTHRQHNRHVGRVRIVLSSPTDDGTGVGIKEILSLGLLYLWHKLLALGDQLAKNADGRLEFEFEIQGQAGFEELWAAWVSTLDGRIRNLTSLSSRQKMAFLMGLHSRLGASSPVNLLSRDTIELILDKVRQQRLEVSWKRGS
jgi:hypothetical protein